MPPSSPETNRKTPLLTDSDQKRSDPVLDLTNCGNMLLIEGLQLSWGEFPSRMSEEDPKPGKRPDDPTDRPAAAAEPSGQTDEAVAEFQRYAQDILKMMRSGMKADLRDEP